MQCLNEDVDGPTTFISASKEFQAGLIGISEEKVLFPGIIIFIFRRVGLLTV